MVNLKYVKPERISLRNHPDFNEAWVQNRIAEDPSILGLGDLILRDRERIQPKAGRLDLLLQDQDASTRYEVELQLGATDESHIIRTIEYWDLERRRDNKYEHCAVIVAEDITSRFLNVISLFNRSVSLIALQMNAYKAGDEIFLVFTRVLDLFTTYADDEDEDYAPTDRAYWEKLGSKETVSLADDILADIVEPVVSGLQLKYNKFYIGLARDGQASNIVLFRAKRKFLSVEFRLKESVEIDQMLETVGLDGDYQARNQRYRIRLTKKELKPNLDILIELMKRSYSEYSGG